MYKKSALLLAAVALATSAFAQSTVGFATVRSVTPNVTRVAVPRETCDTRMEQQTVQAPGTHGGAILGTLLGGVVGSRFGGGNGRLLATAVGAGIGATVGANNDNPGDTTSQMQPIKTCRQETVYEEQTHGYQVVYEYQGQVFTATLPRDPGAMMRVNIKVSPSDF